MTPAPELIEEILTTACATFLASLSSVIAMASWLLASARQAISPRSRVVGCRSRAGRPSGDPVEKAVVPNVEKNDLILTGSVDDSGLPLPDLVDHVSRVGGKIGARDGAQTPSPS